MMAGEVGVQEMEAVEEDVCPEALGLCHIKFDEWEASWGCDGMEGEVECDTCPLLIEDE